MARELGRFYNVCEVMNLGNFNILMSEGPILFLLVRFFSVGTFSNKNLVNFTRKKKHTKRVLRLN